MYTPSLSRIVAVSMQLGPCITVAGSDDMSMLSVNVLSVSSMISS